MTTIDIGNGNFDYVSNIWEREMYENAWQAITLTNMWDFVKQDIDSFMFSLDPRLDTIGEKMAEIGYNGHSGTSFGRTMRQMQYLSMFGEDKFKECFNVSPSFEQIYDTKEHSDSDNDIEANPYEHEDPMEYQQRLKQLIKRRLETGYYEKEDKDKVLDYMGGY
jgi:hypothetical protein